MSVKCGIIGATGYAGVELLRILTGFHKNAKVVAASSVSFEGKPLSEVYPNMAGFFDNILTTQQDVINKSDVVFASLPHGLSQEIAKECAEKGKMFIDLGADFRLGEADYTKWYGCEYKYGELHEKAVYGLPELFRDKIRGAKIIGNPGCYPTSIALGLAPALKNGLIEPGGIIADSKSGVTGAGRGLSQNSHYPDCNEAFSPYKIASHRHTPEIEQTLSILCGSKATVTFVPHLLPVNRGILSTIYTKLKNESSIEEIYQIYQEFYKNERFVRVLPLGSAANLKNVKYSNMCDISLHIDGHNNTLIVVSAIDNMVKGAAGQAIQNMNIICGLNEAEGLDCLVPPAF